MIRRTLPALAVVGALAATPTQASALTTSMLSTSCTPSAFVQPFTRWLDYSHYVLAPGGTFEATTASWGLTGGAAVQSGNEPYYLHSRYDSRSLALPLGSSATSRQMCVGLDYPTMRFTAKGTRGALMRVEVLAGSKLGGTLRLPIGVITGTGSWQVSPVLLIDANLFAAVGGNATAAFKFTPLSGSWSIDDVYVDPYRQR